MSPNRMHSTLYQNSVIPLSVELMNPSRTTYEQKAQNKTANFSGLLQLQPRCTSQIRHNLLTRQQRQKASYDRGTRPLSKLQEGEPVQMKRGMEWKPAVVVKQHQARRSYIVATRMEHRCVEIVSIFRRPRRRHLQPHARHGKKWPLMSQILVYNKTPLVSKRQKWNQTPILRRRNNPPEEVYRFEDHNSTLMKLWKSSFNMTRGRDEDIEGEAPKIFRHPKRGL